MTATHVWLVTCSGTATAIRGTLSEAIATTPVTDFTETSPDVWTSGDWTITLTDITDAERLELNF